MPIFNLEALNIIHIFMAALMQQSFTFSSSTDNWGHLILAPKG